MKKFLPYILLPIIFLLLSTGLASARYSQYFDSGCKQDPCGLNYYFRERDCALCATFVNGLCPFGENTTSGYICKDSPTWGGPYPQCINTNTGFTPDGTPAADFTSFCSSFPPGYFYGFQFYEPPTPTPAPTPTPTPTTFPPCANFGGTCTVSSTCPSGTSEIFGVSCTDPNAICCSNPTATPPPPVTHYSCAGATCLQDPNGPFTDSNCSFQCVVSTARYSCQGANCVGDANGQFGEPTCGGQCKTHYACSGLNQTCQADVNGIYDNSNCSNACPTPAPIGTICNYPNTWICPSPCIAISTPTGLNCINPTTAQFCSGGFCQPQTCAAGATKVDCSTTNFCRAQ